LPAEAEGGTCDRRRERPVSLEVRMEPGFSVPAGSPQHERTRQEQRHRDDERPRDAQQQLLVAKDRAPDRRRRDAEEHEHHREPGHEQRRVTGDPKKVVARSLYGVGEVQPGDDREIARDDRQHAGRHEGRDTTAESRDIAHRVGHLGLEVCPNGAALGHLGRGSLLRGAEIGIVGWDDADRSGTAMCSM